MTHKDMVQLGEDIAKMVVGRVLDASDDPPHLARMTALVAHQLMLMGQVFAESAGLDFVTVYRQELDRAGRWHDDIARMMEQREPAS